eukprot:TRINITY_DN545_c0_g1_i2.p1 TRINITY_DN545_c0_g1~~TRINITY_DN545_c0_g1_i2.p1  ORF type:complete len:161 (-),score=28.69 TRINITY_DN545_c0_g1_i2:150-596(-)
MEESHKILFLDIDGVLMLFNNRGVWNKDCLQQLKRIETETKARIVLSSNWKRSESNMERLKKEFSNYGISVPIDCTPELEYENCIAFSRCKEILKWLEDYPHKVSHWVAVDDMDLSLNKEFETRFIRTGREIGLTSKKADELIALLMK